MLGIRIFEKYDKKRRKREKKERSTIFRTIKSGEFIENADSSSGEEDDRVSVSLEILVITGNICKDREISAILVIGVYVSDFF